jgi:hypothetical protein
MALVARGDESGSDSIRDPGTALVSVVVVDDAHLGVLADAMAPLRRRGGQKFHWRDAPPSQRLDVTRLLADLPITALVVVLARPGTTERPERRRRLCLNTLLPMLDHRGCVDLIWESRGPADDRQDVKTLNYLRSCGYLSSTLRLEHRIGHHDPTLWAADALCGMVVSSRVGHLDGNDYLAILTTSIDVQIIEL